MKADFIPNNEMGNLVREKDWSKTPVGPMESWPQSLRTTLSIILNSRFPMFLWWGPELVCFYNDAYRPSLGENGKHPHILGMRAREAWPEIWDIIKPLIDKVLSGEGATWSEDQLIPIFRNGKIEDAYWTFSYSPVNDESGKATAVLVTCTETTREVLSRNSLSESNSRFINVVQQAPVGIAILRGKNFTFELTNNAYLQFIDKPATEVVGRDLFDVLPDVKPVVEPLLNNVMTSGKLYHANDLEVTISRYGKREKVYFNFIYQPLFENGTVTGVVVVANEVTSMVEARHALEEKQRQFSNFIMQSPIAMTIWRGKDYVIEMANETMFKTIWRKEPKDVIGRKALEVFPELNDQKYPELLRKVLVTGGIHRENESMAYVRGDDGMRKFYLDFEYAPLLETDGSISGIMITVYDVTENVESRHKLEDAESRMRLAVEATELATWDLDLRTRDIIHSPRLAVIFGHPETRVLTHSEMREQLHLDDRVAIVEKAMEQALKTGNYSYEARVILPDRSVRWIRTRGTVVFDQDKQPLRMLGTLMDVTSIRLASEQSSKLAAIVESSDDAIVSKQLDGTITSWNRGAERLFGYKPEEIVSQPITRLIPPDRLGEEPAIIGRLMRGERVEHIETKRVTKDGRLIDVSLTISPIRDQFGRIIGASKIARDISVQKRAEREMEESRLRLETIIEASALGTWELDLVSGKPRYSGRYLEILGFKRDETPTHAELLTRLHPDDFPIRDKAFKQAMQTGKLFYSARLIWPDKSIRWMEGRGNVFFDSTGKAVKMTGTVRDITEEKAFSQALETMVDQRTRELQQVNTELEKMNQELASFAYVSSHDLQEPLRKIQAFASRILEKEHQNLSAAGQDYFSRMQEAARRMQLLIQDLLAYSRTNTKEKELVLTNLNVLVAGVMDDLEQQIQETGSTINMGDLPELEVIPFQFRQLFTNLIANSLKFRRTDVPLVIDIRSEKVKGSEIGQDSATDDYYYRVTVEDNGIGFDNTYHERIFDVFQRLHTKQEYEGTGIGLAICKKIVENHRGFITATGEPGAGAKFMIYLPVS
ncbi:MAG: PAS domain S-box protein [Cyclobacteriaceae bacterium]|nr:PAS domain S-box protein [Cyclobacteriaceae bacterium]